MNNCRLWWIEINPVNLCFDFPNYWLINSDAFPHKKKVFPMFVVVIRTIADYVNYRLGDSWLTLNWPSWLTLNWPLVWSCWRRVLLCQELGGYVVCVKGLFNLSEFRYSRPISLWFALHFSRSIIPTIINLFRMWLFSSWQKYNQNIFILILQKSATRSETIEKRNKKNNFFF